VAAPRESRPTEHAETALIAVGFLVLFFALAHDVVGDGLLRLDDLERLRHHGELSSSKYSLVMPLVSLPFVALGDLIGSPEWWAGRFNVLVLAVGTLVTLQIARGHLDGRVLRRCVLILLFASLLTNHLRDYNAEILTATLTVVGITILATGRSSLVGWSTIVIGVANTPAAIVGLVVISIAETLRAKRLRHLVPIAAAATLIMAEAWIRRGGPLTSGYESDHGLQTILPYSGRPGFSYPFVLGVASILFSFGRGLLFFTPGLFLWLSGHTRRLAAESWRGIVLLLVFVLGLVVAYAKWWAWYGGIAWGPRFFVLAAVPASLAIAFRLAHAGRSVVADAATLVVLTLSAWVGISGAIADPSAVEVCIDGNYALELLCWDVPEFSSLWHPVLDFPALSAGDEIVVAYGAAVFAYLAAPLFLNLVRAARQLPPLAGSWATGWRL
jgi:hypothetical protein